jgi:uncharacterized protein YjdB
MIRSGPPVDSTSPEIAVSPPSAILHVGDTLRLTWKYSEFSRALWSSSDTSIAVVDSLGTVRSRKSGNAVIIARASKDVTVTGAMVLQVVP